MHNFFDILVLDAQSRQSLVAVRSFGKQGFRVAAFATVGNNAPAFFSKWCHKTVLCSAMEGTIEHKEYLVDFLKKNTVSVIIPSSDGTIEMLRKHRKEITQYTHIALAQEKALAIAVNKTKTLSVARTLGISIPRSIPIARQSHISDAVAFIGLPAVIKPVESWTETSDGSKRVAPIFVQSEKEVHNAFLQLTQFGGTTLLQEYVTGRREAISFIYADNIVYAKFAQWAKRTQPPIGGTSVLRESIKMPKDIGELAEKLIRAIDLEGYSEVEFRRDVQGHPYLMEINPRLSASVELAVHAGVDFPVLLYQCAKKHLTKRVDTYTTGIWERYLAGDIISTLQSFLENKRFQQRIKIISDFFLSFFQPMYYDYVDIRDLSPAWNATSDLFIRNIKKVFLK